MTGSPRLVRSEYSLALETARRLAREGALPFADHCSHYVVLHGKRQGERIEFGPPLRAHRMFPTRTRSKAELLGREFAAFAAGRDQSDWCVWAIHQPKTAIKDLVRGLKQFNKRINSVFGQLRKLAGFELLILGIHIEFDHSTQRFDIHAHFVCKVPLTIRKKVRGRLMVSFSRTHTPDEKLRSPHGFAKYAARTYKLQRVVGWPVGALLAAWQLQAHQFRYARMGGAFARFRREIKSRKRGKRKARTRAQNISTDRDQPLIRKMWKIGGEDIPGTLFRSAYPKRSADAAPPAAYYSSAFGAVTQPPTRQHKPVKPGPKDCTNPLASAGNPDGLTLRFALAGSQASMAAKVYGCNRVGRAQVTPDRSSAMSNYVTRIEAHAAADRVDADGKKPSAPAVRQIIGRGSNSTIFEHLKTWVPRDQRLELPPIPDALSNTVSALTADFWHMVLNLASEETAKRIAQATADTEEAQAAAAQIGDQADRLATDLETALERVTQLEKLVAEQNVQIAASQQYADGAYIQNVELTAEINTLRRTLSQFAPTAAETRKSTKQQKANGGDDARPVA